MEDKWFVHLTDGTLYFHRSWTGRCIYWLELGFDTRYRFDRVWASRDPGVREWASDADEVDEVRRLLAHYFDGAGLIDAGS